MTHIRERYRNNGFVVPMVFKDEEEAEFIGKAIRNMRENRQQKRDDRQQFKLDKIAARGEQRVRNTQAGGGIGNALKGIGSNIAGALGIGGGGAGSDAPADPSMNPGSGPQGPTTGAPANNTRLIVIGVLVIVVVVGIVMFVKSRKKKA